jgi:hypothetical protein
VIVIIVNLDNDDGGDDAPARSDHRSITSKTRSPCEQGANKRCPKLTKTALFRAHANSLIKPKKPAWQEVPRVSFGAAATSPR